MGEDYSNYVKYPKLPATELNNVKLYSTQKKLFENYSATYKNFGSNGALAVARSNKTVQYINRALRRDIFGSLDLPLQQGDVLLVTQNNYSVPLTNGDFITVIELGEIKKLETLKFQSVRVKANSTEVEYSLMISIDTLSSKNGNLSSNQMKTLMIDFNYRMHDKEIATNTEKYKREMLSDEFLNCLKVTYGYAVTCHKAQGGEWDSVFLFLDKSMYGMKGGELYKWWYTAITRAKKELNLTNDWWIK